MIKFLPYTDVCTCITACSVLSREKTSQANQAGFEPTTSCSLSYLYMYVDGLIATVYIHVSVDRGRIFPFLDFLKFLREDTTLGFGNLYMYIYVCSFQGSSFQEIYQKLTCHYITICAHVYEKMKKKTCVLCFHVLHKVRFR